MSEIRNERIFCSQASRQEKRATRLFVLFLFQFGLLLPLTPILAHSILISAFTVVLTMYALVYGLFHITRSTIFLFCIPLFLLLIKLPFEYSVIGEGSDVGLQFLVGFLTIGVAGILFGTVRCSVSYFFKVANKIAWINFLLIGFIPFTSLYGASELSINYMKYGYAILPIVLVAYTNIIRGHTSIAQWGLFLCSLLSMIVFGARGANKIAWINFLLIGFIPFTSLYGASELSINYMKYGYAILPIVLVAYTNIIRGHTSIAQWGLFLCSLLSMIVFGARGAQLTFVLFFLVSFLFLSRVRFIWKLLISVVILIGVFALPYLLTQLISILDQYGVSSYSIAKYSELLSGTDFIDTSSGRNFLYEYAYLRILEHPLLGNPFNSCYVDTGGDFYYYHNVFLDLLVNYGTIVTGVLILLLVYVVWGVFTRGTLDEKYLIAILFVVPFGRLVVSSSFWLRPEFWLFLSYSINTFILQRRRHSSLSVIRSYR